MGTLIHRSIAFNGPNDEGRKRPKLLEQQPDVVSRAAQHSVKRIAECTFQRVSPESSVGLHMPDGRLDCAASLNH